MKHLKSYEDLNNNAIEVYRAIRKLGDQTIHDGMFFSPDISYVKIFGHNIQKYIIYPKNTLDLFKYNTIIKEKLQSELSNIIILNYDINSFLNIHSRAIADKWSSQMDYLYMSGLEELADKFEKELEECDSIYGPDSGRSDSKVYYMKKKENIKKI
jgi:hypothetical protein